MHDPGIFLALGLAFIHAFASRFNINSIIPEWRWISFAGGVSVGYVFLEIFPELSHAQEELQHSNIPFLSYLENHIYILALLGLVVFYGLDILATSSRKLNREANNIDATSDMVFRTHVLAFAVLNIIFGYLLQELGEHSLLRCLLFFVAVSLHFFILDYGLREHHKALYDHRGRWLLAAAIIVGAIIAQVSHLNEAAIAIVWSFLAGSMILNILKRELPDEQNSCFSSFVGGALLYSGLILLL